MESKNIYILVYGFIPVNVTTTDFALINKISVELIVSVCLSTSFHTSSTVVVVFILASIALYVCLKYTSEAADE